MPTADHWKIFGIYFHKPGRQMPGSLRNQKKGEEKALGDLGKYRKCMTLCYRNSESEDKNFPGV